MNARVVDTTLRDGEQRSGIALGCEDKVKIAKLLDKLGIYQIEAGIPAIGGDEKKSIEKMMELGLKSKVATWNRMNVKDINDSLQCGADILHISIPSSEIQLKHKLKKSKKWVIENIKKSLDHALGKGAQITVGLEDASRAEFGFLLQIINTVLDFGIKRVRYADTVGILNKQRIFEEITRIKSEIPIGIEIHVHNDFGMAVSNSITAVQAGAEYVDCTIGGIGERAGNCDYYKFIKSAKGCLDLFEEIDLAKIEVIGKEIMKIMFNNV